MSIPIVRLNYVALRAPNPGAAAEFATAKLGFSLAHVDDAGCHYLQAHGPDPYSLVYSRGEHLGVDHLSYLVRDAAALAEVPDLLGEVGLKHDVLDEARWGQDAPAVRVTSPAGFAVEFTTGVALENPPAQEVEVAGRSVPAPIATDHIGLGAPDFENEVEFWGDALGLPLSSRVYVPGGPEVMRFLRAPEGALFHCVVPVRTPSVGVAHIQFSLKNVTSFYAAEKAIKAAGVDVRWGPLRHGNGHNIAMYFQDAVGYWVEFSTEEEIILNHETYEPRDWTVAEKNAVDEWETGPPPPAELMGGPPA